ncbi:hypothetical protein G5C66_01765 [Nocardioides sp. KC13]|uniref:DUF3352 domain-containing protein n=1 Tax=Nocardioides turkmenicus TaxID=2711220 RepID=A0A6M1QUF6_9ACTN|nr:hypothetical protein [Nocardioides sp. KC13]NGN91466.1 hypothetical protein [Nocardioides sp. KC13]
MSETTPGQTPSEPAAEILELGEAPAGKSKKPLIIGAGALLGVAVLAGAGTVAAVALSKAGGSPAEAFPVSTVVYTEVDLTEAKDAVPLLRKLPSLERELGLKEGDDPRESLLAKACDELDFARDLEPWLGYKAAFGAVENGDVPALAFALQVTDESEAEKGLPEVAECAGAEAAWSVSDGWALVAETDQALAAIEKAAEKGTLADDAGFEKWTGDVGGTGFVTAYVSEKLPEVLADAAASGAFDDAGGDLAENPMAGAAPVPDPEELAEAFGTAMKDFDGAALTVRAVEGAFELEGASTVTEQAKGAEAGTVAGTLPKDTTAVIAANPADGWLSAGLAGSGVEDQFTQMLGMAPGDLEKVLGDSFALALGELDLGAPDGLQVGLKLDGADAAGVEKLVGDLTKGFGAQGMVSVDSEGDVTTVGVGDYGTDLLADGGLAGTEKFKNAVPNADDASAVVYVGFDGLDEVVTTEAPEVADDIEALGQLGFSAYLDGDTSRALARITVD